MKTKELIRQLQEADPTGEVECCVGNVDIHYVSREPAYYDGRLQVLLRDEECEYYNIIGAKFVHSGDKVQINTLSIQNAIFEDPELPITFDDDTDGFYECVLKKNVDIWREQAKEIIDYVDNHKGRTEEGKKTHIEKMKRLKKEEDSVWNTDK